MLLFAQQNNQMPVIVQVILYVMCLGLGFSLAWAILKTQLHREREVNAIFLRYCVLSITQDKLVQMVRYAIVSVRMELDCPEQCTITLNAPSGQPVDFWSLRLTLDEAQRTFLSSVLASNAIAYLYRDDQQLHFV